MENKEAYSLNEFTESQNKQRNTAIDTLYNFITAHKTGKLLSKEKLKYLFVKTHTNYSYEAVSLTAKDITDMLEQEQDEPVNKKPYEKAVVEMLMDLEPYCTDPGLEDVVRKSLTAYINSSTTDNRATPAHIKAPVREEPQEPGYLSVVHGKATDDFAHLNSKTGELNNISGSLTVSYNGTKEVISSFNDIAGVLGISTHKLLSVAMIGFTQKNHVGRDKRVLQDLSVAIPLDEYASLTGHDVIEHTMPTAEEQKKEKRRAKKEMDNLYIKVKKDLDILHNSSLSWTEQVRRKNKDFLDVHIIGAKGIRNGYICLSFTQEMGQYLVNLPLTQYPEALLSLDERNPNAYFIGLAMAEHNNMDNNIRQGTANLLKVSTLLKDTRLPGINDSTVRKKGWRDRIKDPFENSLDVLTESNILEDWYYCHSKGIRLTDDEAMNFKSYEEWANTLVYFKMVNAPDHTERLARQDAEKKERKEQAKKKKPVRKK